MLKFLDVCFEFIENLLSKVNDIVEKWVWILILTLLLILFTLTLPFIFVYAVYKDGFKTTFSKDEMKCLGAVYTNYWNIWR